MDGALKRQLDRMLQPIRTRISNVVARAVVQLVDDSTKLQLVQLGVMSGETIDDGERFQPYGLTSVPLAGAEAVVLFPGGDRSNPLVVAVDDRRHRPTGLEEGEVAVYSESGAQVTLKASGDIEVVPGDGGEVRLGGASASDPVALKSDLDALKTYLDAHAHTGVTTGGGTSGPPATSPSPVSAGKVKAE